MKALIVASCLAGIGCGLAAPAVAGFDKQNFATVERGRYLALLGDCAACHTVPNSGQELAGGRPIETPFGLLLSPNITPDRETGIGAWTDDEFVDALTKGTGRDGVHLYPAMPYTYMTRISREDALAIRAFLSTVPPVRNAVTSNELPFPFNVRAFMAVWDWLYFKPGRFRPVAGKSAEWNRGAYLVQGLMHCGMCHTPKNFLGGDEGSQRLRGYAVQGWFAPDITNDARRGLGGWSVDDIVAYLKTGHNRAAAASGPMGEEVARSSSRTSDADLRAVATYLKDLPGQGGGSTAPVPAGDPAMKLGAAIYVDECSGCHARGGSGVPELFPSLKGAPSVQSDDPTSLLHVVIRGARSVGTAKAPTAPAMPSFAWTLNDEQIAAVTTYVRNAWGNAAPAVKAADVGRARQDLTQRND
jgi:mono/diheme cytochrome c family protein